MTQVRIFADSTTDFPPHLAEKFNIGVVPLYVVYGEECYKDKFEITTNEIYNRFHTEGKLPQTAAPAPADFIAAFTPCIERDEQIVFISMSSKISSTYQNATIAASEFPKGSIHVVDSLNVSGGTALLVLKAAKLATEGATAQEIVQMVEEERNYIDMDVLVSQLDFLHKGGRVSSVQHMIGSLLKIRPVLKIKEGIIYSADRYRGKTEKAVERMLTGFIENVNKIDRDLVIIAQTLAEKAADYVKTTLLEKTDIKNVEIIEGGCAISCHCGPGTVALMYKKKPSYAN